MAKPPASSLPTSSGDADLERSLLHGVAAGDQQAFRTLAAKHLSLVVAIARRMLRDPQEAEDIAQDAMLRLWRNAATLELGPYGLKPWLRRVTTNLVIDRIRSRGQTDVMAEVPEQPVIADQARGLENRDLTARVRRALATLPERQRLALTLFHFEGMSQIDVGRALGISDEAVESLLARARRTLKADLKSDWQQLLPDHSDG
ncbi:MAG: sigma-70 family RNA polymerase sigma factor [Hyphomicrobiaceae bacterium]|nr:sigma-70 family RNA polymerase sigma factor [Hyphomicrobiaceae bacterium]